jgi:TRAP-type C4-dicarboxylate transport system permease small subunit
MPSKEQEPDEHHPSEGNSLPRKEMITSTTRGFAWAAAIALFFMMLLITSDVLARALFQKPLLGTYEITQFLMVFVVFFGLAYTAVHEGHVTIMWIFDLLPQEIQSVFNGIAYLSGLILFGLIGWQSIAHGLMLMRKSEVSFALGLPTYPFFWVAALGSFILDLVLLSKLVGSLRGLLKR